MMDTNGPGGPVMTTPLVQGDHLTRDRSELKLFNLHT